MREPEPDPDVVDLAMFRDRRRPAQPVAPDLARLEAHLASIRRSLAEDEMPDEVRRRMETALPRVEAAIAEVRAAQADHGGT